MSTIVKRYGRMYSRSGQLWTWKSVCVALLLCLSAVGVVAQTRGEEYSYSLVENKSELKPGQNPEETIRKNFFLVTEVNKQECYAGEVLMAVFKAYSRLDANSQVVNRPSLTGFSVLEMVDAYSNRPHVEKYGGEYFFVHLIRKVQLFPLQDGELVLEPAEVESTIYFTEKGKRRTSRLRDVFRKSVHHEDTSLVKTVLFKTPEVRVNVKPLPLDNQPEEFTGAVGDFRINLEVLQSDIRKNEPFTVRLSIQGSGNIPLITDPLIEWPENSQVSGPLVTEETDRYRYPLSGEKNFDYTVQATDTGAFYIPPVSFAFFEPSLGEYKTITTDSVRHEVQVSQKSIASNRKEGPSNPSSRLHYFYLAGIVLAILAIITYRYSRRLPK